MIFTILIFILTLLILVVIHELGHFLVAKKFGIKVEEFGFGIPPRAWGKKIGETLVSINWLPFGGFVRLLGEDEVDQKILENKRSFAAQTVTKRILVVVAGVVMNLLLAWLIFYLVLALQGFKAQFPLLINHQFLGVKQTNESVVIIQKVTALSPAEESGLKSGERVIALNSQEIKDSSDLIAKTKSLAGQKVDITLSDPEKKALREVSVTPRQNPPAGQGPLGISLAQVEVANIEYVDPVQKLLAGPIHSVNLTIYSGKILGLLVGKSFETHQIEPVSQTVSGPVGITQAVGTILAEKSPVLPYLNFVAILSLNLAVMNVLPFPALDGGRLFFLVIEGITRRRVHTGFEKWVHSIGMAILLTLMVLITFSDIKKLFP